MADPYVSRKDVNQSYRPKSWEMSPGLQRARAPFRFRNALTGIILASFAIGVWAYSLSAVAQDDFSDIDEEAKALKETGVSSSTPTSPTSITPSSLSSSPTQSSLEAINAEVVRADAKGGKTRGVIASLLEERYPEVLDPKNRTLVWGAPSVDNPGRLRDIWKNRK
ncbi:hypothetical protein C8Q75DRAFT_710727 [Abortiporus biennis]|nr:hypothetical protein C8Q75DRAFT_710727 [Abortiporus biennis]